MPKPRHFRSAEQQDRERRKRDASGWFHPDIQKRIRDIHRACPSCLGDLGTPAGHAIDGTPVCARCVPATTEDGQ